MKCPDCGYEWDQASARPMDDNEMNVTLARVIARCIISIVAIIALAALVDSLISQQATAREKQLKTETIKDGAKEPGKK